MKKIFTRIILVFFISLALSSDDEKYTFIYGESDVGEKTISRYSLETSFTIPKIGLIKYSEKFTETLEYLGVEGNYWKFKATLTDMESDNYVNNIEIMDYYREAMESNPCYLYVKSSGSDDGVDHVEPIEEEDNYLQEAYEATYMNLIQKSFRYPFHSTAVNVAVGDKWFHDHFSSKFYVNMGSPPSQFTSRDTFTLKKIEEKRGRKIASVEMRADHEIEMRMAIDFLGERRLMAGHATGPLNIKFKYNIDSGRMLKVKAIGNFSGDFVMDDEIFHVKIFMRNISKKVQ